MHPKGISFGHLWLNFSCALISTKFAYFWMGTIYERRDNIEINKHACIC